MKKLLPLLIIGVVVLLGGCSDPETSPPINGAIKLTAGEAVLSADKNDIQEYIIHLSSMKRDIAGEYIGPGDAVSMKITMAKQEAKSVIESGKYTYSEELGQINTILYSADSYYYTISKEGAEDKSLISSGECSISSSGATYTITGKVGFKSGQQIEFTFQGILTFDEPDGELIISQNKVEALDRTTTHTINIESNVAWTATAANDWCVVTPTSGSGDGSIEIRINASDIFEPRESSVTISAVDDDKYGVVKIMQNASIDLCDVIQDAGDRESRLSFEAYIYQFRFDVNGDAKLSAYEADLMPQLDLFSYFLRRADFLEYFPNIEYLSLSRNDDISTFTLNSLTKLTHLQAEYMGSLTKIEMGDCESLIFAGIKENGNLATPDFTAHTGLDSLQCDESIFLELPETVRKPLGYIYVNSPSDAVGGVHFADYENVRHLELLNGTLTNLDLRGMNSLQVLRCYFTQASSININGLDKLEMFDCQQNSKLTSIDLSTNTGLKGLHIGNTAITSVNFSANTGLEQLQMTKLNMASVDISMLTKLTQFGANDSALTTIDLSSNRELLAVTCYGTKMTEIDISKNTKLQEFVVVRPGSTGIPTIQDIWVWDSFSVIGSNTSWSPRTNATNSSGAPFYKKISAKP